MVELRQKTEKTNQALLKKLRQNAKAKHKEQPKTPDSLDQSLRKWVQAKMRLNEVQHMLIKAFRDLEAMEQVRPPH